MSIEAILRALDTEATLQAEEIQRSTRAEIARLLEDGRRRAAVVRQEHAEAILPTLRAEQARILNQARLEALQVVLGTRQELIELARAEALRQLAALTTKETYAGLMRQLIQEAAARLGGEMRLRTRARDVELARTIVHDLGLRAAIEGSVNPCVGGVIASDPGGRITLTNTLDTRLERSLDQHRARIAGLLLEDPGDDGP